MRIPVMALIVLASASAAAQAPLSTSRPSNRLTIDRSATQSTSCLKLIELAQKDPKAACVVAGMITDKGKLKDTVAVCEKPAFTAPAEKCFARGKLSDAHAGETGPICAAMVFVPVGPGVLINFREYTPCDPGKLEKPTG